MPTTQHLRPGDRLWPAELATIEAPPVELWIRGDVGNLEHPRRIAIVGSRTPTPYGESQARRFARAFAAAGYCVVSGLARGVDQSAHGACLEAGGPTLAVLGSGVECVWPRGPIPQRVEHEAALLSEFPPDQPPRRHHFPLRNRLIAGLSLGVLVVEAAHASGSLITARWAVDQGKPVWALPGRVDQPMSRGCHRLILDGAQLVESPADVLHDLEGGASIARRDGAQDGAPPTDPLLAALVGETLSCDELCERTGSAIGVVLPQLAELELAGRIARAPGGLYRLRD